MGYRVDYLNLMDYALKTFWGESWSLLAIDLSFTVCNFLPFFPKIRIVSENKHMSDFRGSPWLEGELWETHGLSIKELLDDLRSFFSLHRPVIFVFFQKSDL